MSVRYYDWIAHHGRRNPGKTALIDLASGRRFSYVELDQRISRLAAQDEAQCLLLVLVQRELADGFLDQ